MKREIIRRFSIWLAVVTGLTSGNIAIPSSLSNLEYVPTIANGIVSAISILASITLFLTSHFYQNIGDITLRRRYRLIAMIYWFSMLMVIFITVVIGYNLILANDLGLAFRVFISGFIILIGFIADIMTTSTDFLYE